MARFMKSLLQDRIRERRDPSREPKRVRAAERSILLILKRSILLISLKSVSFVSYLLLHKMGGSSANDMTEVTTTERSTTLSTFISVTI